MPIFTTTVASLPASSTIPFIVTDSATAGDCTTGGGDGTIWSWCFWDGSAWAAFGDGGGAGGSGDVTAVGDCATGDCFQATTARHAFMSPVAGGVATFRAITEADVSDLTHTTDTDTTCNDAGVNCLFAASATEGGPATTATALAADGANCAAGSGAGGTDASGAAEDCTDYLESVAEDTTPQLGGTLDAQGNGVTGLGDVTFQTGASGGTLRTGTSAADLFKLQAYDVDGGVYLDMLELDAGNTPLMSLLHVTEIDMDAGGVIRTGTAAGETALIQARDVDGAVWTTFATLTANNTPTFDLSASTTVGGAAIQTGTDDDVPESGDFGAAADLEADGSLSADTVGLAELAACAGPSEIVEYGASGVPSCIATPTGGGGTATSIDATSDGDDELAATETLLTSAVNHIFTGTAAISSGSYAAVGQSSDGGRIYLGSSFGGSTWAIDNYRGNYVRVFVTGGERYRFTGTALETLGRDVDLGGGDLLDVGGQVSSPATQTCADSGDGSPGFLAVTVSGRSLVKLTNSDADGCTATLSETGATDGQRLEVINVSNAGGTIDFADSAGVQETGTGCSLAVWGSATFRYVTDRFVLVSCTPSN